MKFLIILIISLNTHALQLLQPKSGHNTIKQQSEQSTLSASKLLTQLKKDAKRGNARAQFSLANMYYHGISTNQDVKLALYWYTQVAELGYPSAQFNLGNFYYEGIGTQKNFQQAIFWYEKSANQNLIKAQYKLAKIYHQQGDENTAKYWYEKSAQLGFVRAQLDLAKLYEVGLGIDKDLKLAQHWYEKAAMQFNAEAQAYLNKLIRDKKSINGPSLQEISDSLAENSKLLNNETVEH
ncbi:tetratricopeptide repeat protein [Bathymodiolus septemdierum thioautotrophic gill symbiont]|uniref:Beta-lactamase n=1 Tax=endosymbiont of Bathymodiolus septemdierum str. Myojin knoll TaxID=1303921 RepID=A0A0N7KB80_9GAMM|nr:tetratricopeptide repeat protein [Bathymodiolus septemdierum thioautotrophic gill symbiont]BAS67271.1 hypothetical protein BSEPE_0255 [endosymbiont of Bathymodiolus septemdierum str. Myojin knoll]